MRNASLVLLIASALAACGEADPPKPVAVPVPTQPMVQPQAAAPAPAPAATPAPAAAPQPSADELLAARVKSALRDTRKVDGQGVDVQVAGGAVTLFGTAPTAGERRRIEEFVAGLDGVKSVHSKLVIVRGS